MSDISDKSSSGRRPGRVTQVIVVSSVMFTFISYWRTAAVVLCDMSSTAYYIGAIVETAIGKAAPWFIVAVLLFSYAMRAVYIESSALFVRGGVYRVVKEAMGGFLAKLSVSALLFDYILTGPISGVSAGQYIVGLVLETLASFGNLSIDDGIRQSVKNWGSVLIACAITLYFFRQNLLGIPTSSGKALRIMIAITVMGAIMLTWSGVTLVVKGPVNPIPSAAPDLQKKTIDETGEVARLDPVTGEQEDTLGFIGRFPALAEPLRDPASLLSLVGIIGVIIAFGHSILAMSGEETLAQMYREVEAPKLANFKKAALLVFLYSLLLTGTMNFLALLLIPDELRMTEYYDNWIGGLAMQMVGPLPARLLLNAFVVVMGFLILSGAVNTSILGSNGVLSRVAEDGVLPDWFLKPHHRYGTTSRILWLITGLQVFTIVVSRGNVILLGEAYAFGVVWSFVFKTLSMVILRFKDTSPREFKVPGNVKIAETEVPVGLILIFLLVLLSAVADLLNKQLATVSGLVFTGAFLTVFLVTENFYEKQRRGAKYEFLEQFNQQVAREITAESLGLTKPYRKLVAVRSSNNLSMLEKALGETDPDITDVVVMTAKVMQPLGQMSAEFLDLSRRDQQLMTAVVEEAERAGTSVVPLILPTSNPLHAVLKTAKDIQAQELVVGASRRAEKQLDQIALYWISLHDGQPPGLTVRILSADREVHLDLEGGNRIPKIGERKARSVSELREAGVGVDRVLLVHDGTPDSSDLFKSVLTMLDAEVALDFVTVPPIERQTPNDQDVIQQDQELAKRLKRELEVHLPNGDLGPAIVNLARDGCYNLIILSLLEGRSLDTDQRGLAWLDYLLQHAHCPVFLAAQPVIPTEATE